jgi:AraC-like DNA-binding protein
MDRIFQGKSVVWPDFPAPIQDVVDRGITNGKPFESATMDLSFLPIWDGGKLAYVVCVFVVKRIYQGKPDVAKAKAYIDEHWREKFDPNAVAKALYISQRQLYNLFSQHAGMTPGDYHSKVVVDHIKAALADKSLSIAEAFSVCGANSQGRMKAVFQRIAGVSPTEYRNSLE